MRLADEYLFRPRATWFGVDCYTLDRYMVQLYLEFSEIL